MFLLHLATLSRDSFSAQPQLEIIDLRYNTLRSIDSQAFQGLRRIREIKLAGNRIVHLNSDVFEQLSTLQKLDLSENFFNQFPTVALASIVALKALNLSSNMLQVRRQICTMNKHQLPIILHQSFLRIWTTRTCRWSSLWRVSI